MILAMSQGFASGVDKSGAGKVIADGILNLFGGQSASYAALMIAGILVNKFILIPFYMSAFHMDMNAILGMTKMVAIDTEWKLLMLITGPFNLLKGVVLCLVTGLIYKPLSPILHSKIR